MPEASDVFYIDQGDGIPGNTYSWILRDAPKSGHASQNFFPKISGLFR